MAATPWEALIRVGAFPSASAGRMHPKCRRERLRGAFGGCGPNRVHAKCPKCGGLACPVRRIGQKASGSDYGAIP